MDRRQILFLESDRRQIHLVTASEEHGYYGSLDEVQRELGERFLRCHKSFLVNVEQIRRYSGMQIEAAVRECCRRRGC